MRHLTTKGQVRWVIPAAFIVDSMFAHFRASMDVIAAGWAMRFCQASQATPNGLRNFPIEPERQLPDRGFLV